METIISALIIACSNLTQPSYSRQFQDQVTEQKKQCIKRVTDCVEKLDKKNQFPFGLLKNCSDKVY